MSYCINPNCSNRQNSNDLEYCQSCGTRLLINERYQSIKPLRIGPDYNSEVFEVQDFKQPGTFKVLKCLALRHKDSRVAELFEREAVALGWLTNRQNHPGIPRVDPDGYFEFVLGNGFKTLRCLVMERIEGQNLENWLEQNQPISQEQALNWLQQLLEILDIVHQQKLCHRDIKPSNIMLKPNGKLVLIDFGAVGIGETIINSYGYTPLEQINGETVPQSDFFALGRTFVYLLTGRHPSELTHSKTNQLFWRNLAPGISSSLAQLIDDLMAHAPANRPRNCQVIRQCLQAIDNSDTPEKIVHNTTTLVTFNTPEPTQFPTENTKPPQKPLVNIWLLGGATLLLGLGIAGTLIYQILPCEVLGNFKPCPVAISEHLSFGDKILTPLSETLEKKKGIEAFREGKYDKAVDWLKKAWSSDRDKRDPETLIYLNNAKIEAQKAQSYTIAVAVPLDTNPLDNSSEGSYPGLEVLRGVAQAQDEFNQKPNGARIKVLIADDANNADRAKKIAEAVVRQEEVLAVVGQYTSDSTLAAADIYQKNQLVFVSPTSTSEDLSDFGKSHHPSFFFRTVPSDRFTAQALAQYLIQQANQQNVAVFYNRRSRYSQSLLKEFSSRFEASGGKIVDDSLATALPGKAIDKAVKKGAKVLALFPNTQRGIWNQTLKLINANECKYPMIGGDTLYNPELLDAVGKKAAQCLILAVPWHRMDSPNKEFPQAAEKLWAGPVSWRTALTYDATQVLIKAIETPGQLSRTTVQQVLANPNFQANGATGTIRFLPNGDRNAQESKSTIKLVKLAVNKQGNLIFVPLNTIP